METATRLEPVASASSVGRLRAWCARRFGAGARHGALSLIDQALVSGTNFFTTVIIGRACAPEELGVYSLTFTLMVVVTCVHQALMTTPYTIFLARTPASERGAYTGGILIQQGILSLLAAVCLAATAGLFHAGYGLPELAPAIGALAALMPLMLLREFARRYYFAQLKLPAATALDACVSLLHITGLSLLAARGQLDATTAFCVTGLTTGLAGGVWLASAWRTMTFTWPRVAPLWRHHWQFGRWILAAQLALLAQNYLVPWLLAFARDVSAAGVFSACVMIVFLSKPFIQGVGNFLSPWIARAFAEGGASHVRRVVAQATLLTGACMGTFFFVVLYLGEWLLQLFYGNEYVGHGPTISLLAGGALLTSLGLAVSHGLWTMDRPRVNFAAQLASLVVTIIAAYWLIPAYGSVGAAVAMLLGNVASSSVMGLAFYRLTQEIGSVPASPCEVAPQ